MLTAEAQWKEIIIVTGEDGQEYVVSCGWGVSPPSAYIPAEVDWRRQVPEWLHDRRDELVALLESTGHVVHDEPAQP